MKYKYNCLNKMTPKALTLLDSKYQESSLNDANIVFVRSTDMQNMELNDNALIIGRTGIGVNTIPFKEYANKGIVVVNTPGGNANGVKELTVLALVLAVRDIFGATSWVNSIKDDNDLVERIEKEKNKFTGSEIQGKVLGIIGLGAIGGLVANIAIDLGMDVIGYDPYISIEHAWGLSKYIKRVNSLDELYKESNIISIHTPLKDDTRGILNKSAFEKMNEGTVIINIARAALVNDDDLSKYLESGHIARYITDFPNPKTVKMKNTICFPHIGGATEESEEKCSIMAVKEVIDFIENGNITNSVNYPKIQAGICEAKVRITICHKNKSGMISKFSNILSSNNIAKMFNNSLEDIAYTIFDLDQSVTNDEIKLLESIDGVIRVRVL